MRIRSRPASGRHKGNAFRPAITGEPPGRIGASHSSHARLRAINARRQPTASQRVASTGAGGVGVAALVFIAISLVLTIDRTLNGIWRVRHQRPLGQRVLIYWAVMTLAPLLLGASLSLTSYVISESRGIVAGMPGALQLLF